MKLVYDKSTSFSFVSTALNEHSSSYPERSRRVRVRICHTPYEGDLTKIILISLNYIKFVNLQTD